MEMLMTEGAQVLASYDHYSWNKYAAVTKNRFGKGCAFYLGCMTGKEILEKVLEDALQEAGATIPAERFPVIVRKGKNDLGKDVRFYLNYSAKEQSVTNAIPAGCDLLSGAGVKGGDTLAIDPWGVRIVEAE